jgi:hypothetical protein
MRMNMITADEHDDYMLHIGAMIPEGLFTPEEFVACLIECGTLATSSNVTRYPSERLVELLVRAAAARGYRYRHYINLEYSWWQHWLERL